MVLEMVGTSALTAGVAWFVTRKLDKAKYEIFVEQAKAKAKAIEHEAELVLKDAKSKIREQELELKRHNEAELRKIKGDYESKLVALNRKEESMLDKVDRELEAVEREKTVVEQRVKELGKYEAELDGRRKMYQSKTEEVTGILRSAAGLTSEEAKELLLERVEEEARADMANIVRRYENEAKLEAKRKANYIIAQATTRVAGEFASERLINTITLSNDEFKGRIIGKEGRNIKTLEMLLGVDIIIDDTPGAIIVSSFNLYRRAIATKTIQMLVEDGRIQPTRIEEIFEKVTGEFEESLMEEGHKVACDLNVGELHPELVRLVGRLKYRASFGQNALGHSIEVARLAGIMAAEMDGDEKLARRAGLLHDIGKSLTQDFEGNHVDLGADVCKRYKEHPTVINAIYAHHGHKDPDSIESAAVCAADALSAARPGARREVLENFLKRVQEIEEIATSKHGVLQAYAISAGREVRVIVNAALVSDNEAVLLAREIAREIEKNVQYPGEIKVNVIREIRAVEMAK